MAISGTAPTAQTPTSLTLRRLPMALRTPNTRSHLQLNFMSKYGLLALSFFWTEGPACVCSVDDGVGRGRGRAGVQHLPDTVVVIWAQ